MAWEDALAVLRTVVSDAVGDVDADAPIYYAPPARIPHKGVSVVWQVAGPEVSRRPSDVRRSLYEQVVQVYRWLPSDLRPEQTVMLSGELNDIVAAINDALDGNLQLDGQAVSVDPPVWDDAEGVSYGDATSTYVMMSCSIGVEVEKLNAGFGAGSVAASRSRTTRPRMSVPRTPVSALRRAVTTTYTAAGLQLLRRPRRLRLRPARLVRTRITRAATTYTPIGASRPLLPPLRPLRRLERAKWARAPDTPVTTTGTLTGALLTL